MRSDCPTCVLCRFWLRVRPVCDWCQASTRTNVTRHSKTCFQAPGPIWASTRKKEILHAFHTREAMLTVFRNHVTSLPKTCYPSAFLCMLSTCRNTQLRLEQWIHAFRFSDMHSLSKSDSVSDWSASGARQALEQMLLGTRKDCLKSGAFSIWHGLKSGEAGALLLCRRWKFGGVEALKELEAH